MAIQMSPMPTGRAVARCSIVAMLALLVTLAGGPQPVAAQDDANLGEVHVVSYLCPATADPAADPVELTESCHDDAAASMRVNFSLTGTADLWFKVYSTSFDESGTSEVSWDEVEPGPAAISQDLSSPDYTTLAFCGDGSPDSAELEGPLTWNAGTVLEITPGSTTTCLLFNFPPSAGATPILGDSGEVHLTGLTCPASASPDDDLATLVETCVPDGDIDFSVSSTSAFSDTKYGSGTPGAMFENVPSGKTYVIVWMPEGYDAASAYCSSDPADPADFVPVPVDLDDVEPYTGDVTIATRTGTVATCHFYLFTG